MMKTIILFLEDGRYFEGYYFGTLHDIMKKQSGKINWRNVIATATVPESDEYPELKKLRERGII